MPSSSQWFYECHGNSKQRNSVSNNTCSLRVSKTSVVQSPGLVRTPKTSSLSHTTSIAAPPQIQTPYLLTLITRRNKKEEGLQELSFHLHNTVTEYLSVSYLSPETRRKGSSTSACTVPTISVTAFPDTARRGPCSQSWASPAPESSVPPAHHLRSAGTRRGTGQGAAGISLPLRPGHRSPGAPQPGGAPPARRDAAPGVPERGRGRRGSAAPRRAVLCHAVAQRREAAEKQRRSSGEAAAVRAAGARSPAPGNGACGELPPRPRRDAARALRPAPRPGAAARVPARLCAPRAGVPLPASPPPPLSPPAPGCGRRSQSRPAAARCISSPGSAT